MKKYYIHTFGCQMNVHDSERMAGILRQEGYSETADPLDADLVLFNTCSIRQKAEQKFYSKIGRFQYLKRKNPGIKIAVAGCIAQQEGQQLLKRVPHIDYVFGPQNVHFVGEIIKNTHRRLAIEENPLVTEMELPVYRKEGVSAWINIMHGCDNFCSYCVVPYTRGREKSRASLQIISEINDLAEKGYKEVTLLGQNVNSYQSDTDFPGLLREINKINGIERIRFVTSHPKDLSEELMHAIRDLEKVCEHIHLPLQSGSTRMLKLMNRNYSFDEYLGEIDLLRSLISNIAITSDIISGFPDESDEDHLASVNALRQIQFDGIFAFKFSSRPHTRASVMKGQISEYVKSQRLNEIIKIQNEITELKNKTLVGTIQEVLIEGCYKDNADMLMGRTRTNKVISILSSTTLNKGAIIKAKIIQSGRHSLMAEPLI